MSRIDGRTSRSLFLNSIYILGVSVVPAGLGFAFWGLASRLYSPAEVGLASAVISAAALVSGIAGLGMGSGLIRFLPESRSPQRLLNSTYTLVILTALLSGSVFLAGLSLWSPALVALRDHPVYSLGFLVFGVSVALGTLVRATFVARRQSHYALVYTSLANGIRLPLVIWGVGLSAAGVVAPVVLAFVLALLISGLVHLPRVEAGFRFRPGLCWSDLRSLMPFSIGNYAADLALQMNQTVLPLVILGLLGPAANGHAYVALMLGGLLTAPGAALAGSAFAEGANSSSRVDPILARASRVALLVTVLLGCVACVIAPWLLMLFGVEYSLEASGLLRWLAAAAPVAVHNQMYFTRLRLSQRIGRLVVLSFAIAITSLAVSTLLMPRFGIAACGLGNLLGNGLVAIPAAYDARRSKTVATDIIRNRLACR